MQWSNPRDRYIEGQGKLVKAWIKLDSTNSVQSFYIKWKNIEKYLPINPEETQIENIKLKIEIIEESLLNLT